MQDIKKWLLKKPGGMKLYLEERKKVRKAEMGARWRPDPMPPFFRRKQ